MACAFALLAALALCGCGSSETQAAFSPTFQGVEYSEDALYGTPDAGIDVSHASQGYVCAVANSQSKLKLQVICGSSSAAYDMESDGSPTYVPLAFGNGSYTLNIMQNTSGERYVPLYSITAEVSLEDEFQPFIRPNYFCWYTQDGGCATTARQLTEGAATQTEALQAIYDYVVENVVYDYEKASTLGSGAGYVPNPEETLETGMGICSDYASVAAAMLRSVCIPAKVVCGKLPTMKSNHAWNMVYVDGSWQAVGVDVVAGTWSRIDPTFAASMDSIQEDLEYEDGTVY